MTSEKGTRAVKTGALRRNPEHRSVQQLCPEAEAEGLVSNRGPTGRLSLPKVTDSSVQEGELMVDSQEVMVVFGLAAGEASCPVQPGKSVSYLSCHPVSLVPQVGVGSSAGSTGQMGLPGLGGMPPFWTPFGYCYNA